MRPRGSHSRILFITHHSATRPTDEGPVALRPRLTTGLPFYVEDVSVLTGTDLNQPFPALSLFEVAEVDDLLGDVAQLGVAVLGRLAQGIEGGVGGAVPAGHQ